MDAPLLTLNLNNKTELQTAIMPFVKNLGLFITTVAQYKLGQEVTIALQLRDPVASFTLSGKIVWLATKQVGVQINTDDVQKIELLQR